MKGFLFFLFLRLFFVPCVASLTSCWPKMGGGGPWRLRTGKPSAEATCGCFVRDGEGGSGDVGVIVNEMSFLPGGDTEVIPASKIE